MCIQLMIVEDEPLEKKALKTIIEANFTTIQIVAEPTDGKDAWQKMNELRPSLVIIDIGIPGMDGLTLQQKIVKRFPETQMIILTAYSDFEHVHQALTNHAIDYLVKPVRPQKIVASLKKAMEISTMNPLSTKKTTVNKTTNNKMIKQAFAFVEKNYAQEITQKEVAESCYLHPQYFSRLFRKETSVAFKDYLLQFRIEKAKELLLKTNKSVYEIAVACGFNDSAYFCKKFRQLMKRSPLQYRKSVLNGE